MYLLSSSSRDSPAAVTLRVNTFLAYWQHKSFNHDCVFFEMHVSHHRFLTPPPGQSGHHILAWFQFVLSNFAGKLWFCLIKGRHSLCLCPPLFSSSSSLNDHQVEEVAVSSLLLFIPLSSSSSSLLFLSTPSLLLNSFSFLVFLSSSSASFLFSSYLSFFFYFPLLLLYLPSSFSLFLLQSSFSFSLFAQVT